MSDPLADEIIAMIATHVDGGRDAVTRETALDELGIHSLELTEIIFDVEDKYGIEVDMNTSEAWNNLKNVGDIVEAVRTLIEAKG